MRRWFLCARKFLADCDSPWVTNGNGISPPFCRSSSATGNVTGGTVCVLAGNSDSDDVGSAVANASISMCSDVTGSTMLGLACRASAYSAPSISFSLTATKSASSGDAHGDNVGDIGSTKARSTYFVVMNFNRVSRDDPGAGRCDGSILASHTLFDTRLPIEHKSSIRSGVNDVTSSVSDLTLEMCVPNER